MSLGGTTSDFKSVISSSDLATSPSNSRDDPAFVRAAQTSLCELSELLKRGEKQGMFRQQMPPRILATITHDNLTFLRDKDLYSTDYFSFIYNACFLALVRFLIVTSLFIFEGIHYFKRFFELYGDRF